MVSEITIDEAEDLFNEATNSIQSFEGANKLRDERINGDSELDVDVVSKDYIRRISSEGIDLKDKLAFWETMGNGDLGPRKMRALFDYDPVKDSPNVDSEVSGMFLVWPVCTFRNTCHNKNKLSVQFTIPTQVQ